MGETFTVEPDLSGLEFFEATIPLSKGEIKIKIDLMGVEAYSDELSGTLLYEGNRYTIEAGKTLLVNKGK